MLNNAGFQSSTETTIERATQATRFIDSAQDCPGRAISKCNKALPYWTFGFSSIYHWLNDARGGCGLSVTSLDEIISHERLQESLSGLHDSCDKGKGHKAKGKGRELGGGDMCGDNVKACILLPFS